ncbi:hypothetical protein [Roseococcus sp.]|uniref:hypothetical protein n=1 Tax=Roseococcus sp. TaxID=2109646 RepID=UPI003BACFBDB
MRPKSETRRGRLLVLGLLAPMLSGCGSLLGVGTETGAGVAGAAIATAATSNATVAAGIGLGVAAGARAGLQYAQRRVHRNAQNAVAAAAGGLAPGQVGSWVVRHSIPIEPSEQGEVVVTRVLGNDVFACREIIFSVDKVEDRQPVRSFYTAMICRDATRWRWASAEPATERWGSLQ